MLVVSLAADGSQRWAYTEDGGHDDYGDIYIQDCTPTVTGCDIGYSSAYGIYLDGTTYPDPAALRANNTFHDNASGDVYVPPTK